MVLFEALLLLCAVVIDQAMEILSSGSLPHLPRVSAATCSWSPARPSCRWRSCPGTWGGAVIIIIHHHYNHHHHHEPVDLDRPGQGAEVLLVLLTVGVVPDRAPHPAVVTAADLNIVQAESESPHVVKSNFCGAK